MDRKVPVTANSGMPGKQRRIPVFLVAVLLLLAGMLATLLYDAHLRNVEQSAPLQTQVDLLPDPAARDGILEEEAVESGSFRLVFNSLPTIEAGSRICNVEFENPAGNEYDARLALYLGTTGNLLGHTNRVEVGKRVDELTLNRDLPAGEHKVLGRVELFDGDNLVQTLPVELTIRIVEVEA